MHKRCQRRIRATELHELCNFPFFIYITCEKTEKLVDMEKLNSKKNIKQIKTDLADEIVKDAALKALRACIQCGNCTASCPSGRRTSYRTREIIRKACLGLDEVLEDEDIWLCTTCYTCYERCIRDIPITDIIIKLRNMASDRGHMLPAHVGLTHMFIKTGHGVPLGDTDGNWAKLREALGLQKVPPTVHSHPEAVEEVQKLIKELKFDELVGFGKEEEEEK